MLTILWVFVWSASVNLRSLTKTFSLKWIRNHYETPDHKTGKLREFCPSISWNGRKIGTAVSYCKILPKLWDAIQRKCLGLITREFLSYHKDSRPNKARIITENLKSFGNFFNIVVQSRFSSDCSLYDCLNYTWVVNVWRRLKMLTMRYKKWLMLQSKDLYAASTGNLIKR